MVWAVLWHIAPSYILFFPIFIIFFRCMVGMGLPHLPFRRARCWRQAYVDCYVSQPPRGLIRCLFGICRYLYRLTLDAYNLLPTLPFRLYRWFAPLSQLAKTRTAWHGMASRGDGRRREGLAAFSQRRARAPRFCLRAFCAFSARARRRARARGKTSYLYRLVSAPYNLDGFSSRFRALSCGCLISSIIICLFCVVSVRPLYMNLIIQRHMYMYFSCNSLYLCSPWFLLPATLFHARSMTSTSCIYFCEHLFLSLSSSPPISRQVIVNMRHSRAADGGASAIPLRPCVIITRQQNKA